MAEHFVQLRTGKSGSRSTSFWPASRADRTRLQRCCGCGARHATKRLRALPSCGHFRSSSCVVHLLTIDLGKPLRFWHMMINTTPGSVGLNFKPWSPISLGTWALLIFSLFAFVSFLEVITKRGNDRNVSGGMIVWNVIGSLVALFLASYTGVVLSVSNQPVWSDSYAIGGLFVASALSASAAFLPSCRAFVRTMRLQPKPGWGRRMLGSWSSS